MPFSWYQPDVPEGYRSGSAKALAMYEDEIRERATLLMGLGYSREDAKARLRGNVRWDFECNGAPAHLKRVGAIVDKVYTSRGSGQGGPPTL